MTGERGDNPAWLESKLAASEKTFKIVVMHHPLFAFAKHHGDWSDPDHGNDLQSKRRKLLDLFEREGVQIVFSGHQHMFEHDILTVTNERGDREAIHFVITGGGGAPPHRGRSKDEIAQFAADYRRQGLEVACDLQAAVYNYCVVDIDPREIAIRVFEVSESEETDGRLVDRFVVRKSGAGPGS